MVHSSRSKVFEAYTDCPFCGEWAVHWLRFPSKRVPMWVAPNGRVWGSVDEVDESRIPIESTVFSFGSSTPSNVVRAASLDCRDERVFEVVRECRECGREWGEV